MNTLKTQLFVWLLFIQKLYYNLLEFSS